MQPNVLSFSDIHKQKITSNTILKRPGHKFWHKHPWSCTDRNSYTCNTRHNDTQLKI